jgi:TonB family protein
MKTLIPFLIVIVIFSNSELSAQIVQAPTDSITRDSIKIPEKIYDFLEIMPEFPGGKELMFDYFEKNLIYPEAAIKYQVEGRVYVKFVVDEYGNILMPMIARGLIPECDAEAIRLINNMPTWVPGKQNGQPAAAWYIIPIKFSND